MRFCQDSHQTARLAHNRYKIVWYFAANSHNRWYPDLRLARVLTKPEIRLQVFGGKNATGPLKFSALKNSVQLESPVGTSASSGTSTSSSPGCRGGRAAAPGRRWRSAPSRLL